MILFLDDKPIVDGLLVDQIIIFQRIDTTHKLQRTFPGLGNMSYDPHSAALLFMVVWRVALKDTLTE